MSKEIKDISASVRAKLSNVAKAENKSFDSILLLYMQERLLYRISISEYKDNFVLKGGLLMYLLSAFTSRQTKDVDFLARHISNDLDCISDVFKSISDMDLANIDGIKLDKNTVTVERIKEDADYEGVRVKVTATLCNARKVLQLDIGFGDIVIPKPLLMDCPVILDINLSPTIFTYSVESVIAEKFQAMIALSAYNSRMKDFYDIYFLMGKSDFEGRKLQEAIFETLEHRATHIESGPIIFTEEFHQDVARNRMWKAFLNKIGANDLAFSDVMVKITTFLEPIYDAILIEKEFFGYWNHGLSKWVKNDNRIISNTNIFCGD
jgi:predicted nucleotidyltransferase component of viral defense system